MVDGKRGSGFSESEKVWGGHMGLPVTGGWFRADTSVRPYGTTILGGYIGVPVQGVGFRWIHCYAATGSKESEDVDFAVV